MPAARRPTRGGGAEPTPDRAQRHPRRFWAARSRLERREAIDVLRGLGFEGLWFADGYKFVAEREDARRVLCQRDPDRMSLHLRSPNPAVLYEVGAVVERELGLSTERVHALSE